MLTPNLKQYRNQADETLLCYILRRKLPSSRRGLPDPKHISWLNETHSESFQMVFLQQYA